MQSLNEILMGIFIYKKIIIIYSYLWRLINFPYTLHKSYKNSHVILIYYLLHFLFSFFSLVVSHSCFQL